MPRFKVVSDFAPTGDQPQAVDELVEGIERGLHHQTLLGVTGERVREEDDFAMCAFVVQFGRFKGSTTRLFEFEAVTES